MNLGKYLATPLVALTVMASGGCPASDPGKPGKAHHPTVFLASGSVLGKSTYGLWHATNKSASCDWTVTMKGKIAASGGGYDAIISTPGLNGGVVHAKGCGKFAK